MIGGRADRVIVVGAGPVGLVAALLLAERGIPVTVLEAEPQVSDDLRASTFHPPTLDMLDPFGVTAALVAQGVICPDWQIRMHETGEYARFDMSVLAGDTNHPYRLQCEQAKMARHLAERLAGHDMCDLRFGAPVTSVGQDSDHAWVDVDAGDGTERLTAAYVIGADGANSRVRQSLGLEFAGKTYPETTVLVSTPFDFQAHLKDLSNVTYCWSAEGNFALLKLKGFWRCSLYYDPDLTFEQATSDERVQAQLRQIHPKDTPYEIIDRRPYRVHQRIVEDYRQGRIILAGDAAHLNAPSGGMGMNGGVHDAFNLVDKLARVLAGADPALLDLYTRQRRPIAIEEIQRQADTNRKRMTERDPARRRESLRQLQAIAEDRTKLRGHLLRSSMIEGLRRAETIT